MTEPLNDYLITKYILFHLSLNLLTTLMIMLQKTSKIAMKIAALDTVRVKCANKDLYLIFEINLLI